MQQIDHGLHAHLGFYLGPSFSLRAKSRIYVALLAISLAASASALSSKKAERPPAAAAIEPVAATSRRGSGLTTSSPS